MSLRVTLLIVEKTGNIKTVNVKEYNESELYKKCGFKIADGFSRQCEWKTKLDGQKMVIHMYGKTDGRANTENMYEFPPPVDNKLLFGNCILVGMVKSDDGALGYINLTIELWTTIYEKLFGGFDDLTNTEFADEHEADELDNVSTTKKTKSGGYLKDGFVVDSDNESDTNDADVNEDNDTNDSDTSEDNNKNDCKYSNNVDDNHNLLFIRTISLYSSFSKSS